VYKNIPITLFTDQSTPLEISNLAEVRAIPDPHYSNSDKFYALLNSPFDRTVYLDTDVHVRGGLETLFGLLDRFDVLACYAANRFQYPEYELQFGTLAEPQLNGGVLALRDARNFAKAWKREYDRFVAWLEANVAETQRKYWDQVGLRVAVITGGFRLHVLPPEYNTLPNQVVGSPPLVVHNRAFVSLNEAKKEAILSALDSVNVQGACRFHARLFMWRGRGTVARALWSLLSRGYVAIRL
jgi:hypothetical protein